MTPLLWLLLCSLVIFGLAAFRIYSLLPKSTLKKRSARLRDASDTCTLAVFLGSGGHTSEALGLVSALDFSRYAPRKYIISEGDELSAQKAGELETKIAEQQKATFSFELSSSLSLIVLFKLTGLATSYEVMMVPRARRVHQSMITTPPTAIWSLISILKYLIQFYLTSKSPFADVLLLNGPGTCFVLCVALYVAKFFGLPTPRMVYVESFARVNSLSLSGKLLRPFVDRFIVQWPQLLNGGGRGDCRGWLV